VLEVTEPANRVGATPPPGLWSWLSCYACYARSFLKGAAIGAMWLWGWDFLLRPILVADGSAPQVVLSTGDILSRVGAGLHLTWVALRPWLLKKSCQA